VATDRPPGALVNGTLMQGLPIPPRDGYTARPMAQIREIKKRMNAVRTIQRITKTMQMIATAKFTAALNRAKQTRPYTDKVRELVAQVSTAAGDVRHPLIDGPATSPKRELLLVISSDRGLCGAFNGNVLRKANQHIREVTSSGASIDLHTAGKKAVGFFKFQRVPIAQRLSFGDKIDYAQVKHLAEQYMEGYTGGRYDAIRVASMRFVSNARQVPEIMQLLPLKSAAPVVDSGAGASDAPAGSYEFSPSSAELLTDLLPLAVQTSLFQAFIDAVVSEQIMRMVAMKGATENAKELGKSLRRDFNRARQTRITTELMEVISGSAALA
jgi:F-type H+-transporting ATPase subunit gamma